MRIFILSLVGCLLIAITVVCLLIAAAANAQNASDKGDQGNPTPPRAAVIADEENGVVTIVINGKEVGRFDENGLAVEGHITGQFNVRPVEQITATAPLSPQHESRDDEP